MPGVTCVACIQEGHLEEARTQQESCIYSPRLPATSNWENVQPRLQ